jgi:hypothetical protein
MKKGLEICEKRGIAAVQQGKGRFLMAWNFGVLIFLGELPENERQAKQHYRCQDDDQ